MPIDASIPLRASRNALQQRNPMGEALAMSRISENQRRAQMEEQQLQMQQEEVARQNALREQMGQIATLPPGDRDAAIQQMQLEQGDISGYQSSEKHRGSMLDNEQKRARSAFEYYARALPGINDQQSFDRWRAGVGKDLPDFLSQIPEQFSPQAKQQLLGMAQTVQQQFQGMRADRSYDLQAQTAQDASQRGWANVNIARANSLKKTPGTSVRTDENGNLVVDIAGGANYGAPALSNASTRKLQGAVVDAYSTALELNRIKELFDPEVLTLQGRGISWFLKNKDKIGGLTDPQEVERLQQATRFKDNVNQFFNRYRKEITGAAASVQEMEALKESIFNTDQGPAAFQASFDEFQRKALRGARLKSLLLRDQLRPGSKQFTQRHNALWKAGADDDIDQRGDELQGQGKAPEEVVQILRAEGYLQ